MKFCVKRLYHTESIKYLGVRIYTNHSWQYGINDISIKLKRANAFLFKMRKQYTLVLKYWNPSILSFLTPTYPSAALSELRIVAPMNFSFTKRLLELLISNQGISI